MGIKLNTWDADQVKIQVGKKYKSSTNARVYLENTWMRTERIVFSQNPSGINPLVNTSVESAYSTGMPGVDNSYSDVNAAYTFKNFRFIHAQMSSNPPSVAMRPATSDQEDHRRADAADRVSRWAVRHYNLQEKVDQQSLNTLLYGSGVIKTVWDAGKGDIMSYDEATDEIELEGDIDVSVPFIWNIFLDPDAKCIDDLKWVIERIYMDYEEACMRWPDKQDLLKKSRIEETSAELNASSRDAGRNSELQNRYYNAVELLEYWETGLPTNGYLGRYVITTTEGEEIQPCGPNPFRFRRSGAATALENKNIPDQVKEAKLKSLPEQARLPYVILTDIDVPNMVWGKSSVEYAANMQEQLTRLDSAVMDNIQAHGVARAIIPDSAEITEMSNSGWDVMKISGNQPPYFMEVPSLMPEMTSMRKNLIDGINDTMGVNEAMFGQQSREQSGASMQYATNQGNMIRRRLFNKYVLSVECLYKNLLDLVRKHWTIPRTISVLGKEKALDAIDLKGADIDGGYDVVGEYGVNLSLDPITRRQEIMTLQPMFEKAGIPTRTSLKMMKMNELEGMYDKLELAGNRQKEIFDLMIAGEGYIQPKKYRDHENMIAWALDYFMTSEYEMLDSEVQKLCEKHIEERAQLAASEKGGAPNAQTAPGTPGPDQAQPTEAVPPSGAPAPTPANPPSGEQPPAPAGA